MLYFIRHAQSNFNFDADIELRQKLGPKFSKMTEEYKSLKFDKKYLDSELTKQGKEQCLPARQQMAKIDVDLVIVSPMRRAMQTCDIIFKDHPSKPKIIVEPGIREIFSSACDIGSRLQESMQEMPYFDYSRIKEPPIWYLHSIKNQEMKQYLLEQVQHLPEQERKEAAETMLVEYLKGIYGIKTQFHLSDMPAQRVLLKQYGQGLKNVAVVTHYENIFAITKIQPNNAQILKMPIDQL